MRRVSALPFITLVLSLAGCAPTSTSAFVSGNLKPDANCVLNGEAVSGSALLLEGKYDVSKAGIPRNKCVQSYHVALVVNSELRASADMTLGRTEPNVLQITGAEVTIKSVDGSLIVFNRTLPAKPNPFRTIANTTVFAATGSQPARNVAWVEAIPSDYAAMLDTFAKSNRKILLDVQLFGTTLGDEAIDIATYTYPVKLCWGCYSVCAMAVEAAGETAATVYGRECPDNAGADGRYCIDPDC